MVWLCDGPGVAVGCELLRFFMARMCMNLTVFSFMACGKLSTCIILLISSFVSLTSEVLSFLLSSVFGVHLSLPLCLCFRMLVCSLSLFDGMGLRPRQFLHALLSLWLLRCLLFKLALLCFSSSGWSFLSCIL